MWCRSGFVPVHDRAGVLAALIPGIVVGLLMLNPRQADGDTQVVPSITVSERYDTNVFSTQQSAVPDKKLWDFVTTASPSLSVNLGGRDVSGSIRAGFGLSAYVNNPELNNVSASGALNLTMDGLAGRLVRRLRLSVVDVVAFTPEQPTFFKPEAERETSDPSAIGIQRARADSLRNSVTLNASYPIMPTVSLQGSYTNTIVRFGTVFAPEQGAGLLDTTSHSVNSGLSMRRRRDTIALSYGDSFSLSGSESFQTPHMTLTYTRTLTPTLSAALNGGVTVVIPSDSVQYVAGASLSWKGENRGAAIRWSRVIVPSFAVNATALISDAVGVSARYSLTRKATLAGSLNYAVNRAVPDSSVLIFQSYGASLSLSYTITRTVSASLSYNYSNFETEQLGRVTSAFDRHAVTLAVSGTWTYR